MPAFADYHPGEEPVPGYRLTHRLAARTDGVVWAAVEAGSGKRVAVRMHDLTHPGAGLRDYRVVRLAQRLTHPHLATVLAARLTDRTGTEVPPAAADDGQAVQLTVVSPLGEMSLADKLKELNPGDRPAAARVGLPLDEAVGYADGAAKALDYLNTPYHGLGNDDGPLVHAAVKPGNLILIGREVVLTDAYLASAVGPESPRNGEVRDPAYAPPELAVHKPGPGTDQYMLAVTYYELRTGRPPVPAGLNRFETVRVHAAGKLDFSSPRVSDEERRVLGWATARQPSDRYASCREFTKQLKRIAVGKEAYDPRQARADRKKLPIPAAAPLPGTAEPPAAAPSWQPAPQDADPRITLFPSAIDEPEPPAAAPPPGLLDSVPELPAVQPAPPPSSSDALPPPPRVPRQPALYRRATVLPPPGLTPTPVLPPPPPARPKPPADLRATEYSPDTVAATPEDLRATALAPSELQPLPPPPRRAEPDRSPAGSSVRTAPVPVPPAPKPPPVVVSPPPPPPPPLPQSGRRLGQTGALGEFVLDEHRSTPAVPVTPAGRTAAHPGSMPAASLGSVGSVPTVESAIMMPAAPLPPSGSVGVRFTSPMRPGRAYPLEVYVPWFGRTAVRGIAEPVLPGCDVYPPRQEVSSEKPAVFRVVPRVRGPIAGTLTVRRGGDLYAEATVPATARSFGPATAAAVGAVVVPLVMAVLRMLPLNPEAAAGPAGEAARWLIAVVPPEVYAGLLAAVSAGLFAFARPRSRDCPPAADF